MRCANKPERRKEKKRMQDGIHIAFAIGVSRTLYCEQRKRDGDLLKWWRKSKHTQNIFQQPLFQNGGARTYLSIWILRMKQNDRV